MRILILANNDMGLYKFRGELLEALAEKHELFFSVPAGSCLAQLEALGCRYVPCHALHRRSANPIRDLMLLIEYVKTVRTVRPDVVLSYTIKPNVYGGLVCAAMRIPCLANVTGLGTAVENGGLLSKISLSLYRLGLRRASCVFFQNAQNMALFQARGIVRGRARLLPGSGVNLRSYCPAPYPSDEEGVRFLFVGRIMKDKGIEELLQALRLLRAEGEKVAADLVGHCDEDYSGQLTAAEQAGELFYHGVQQDVRPFYAACHCAVLPSYHEGMANVMLEAAAMARPVITTRVPGCRETFDEGLTGLGCEARDAESLAEAMRRFIGMSQAEREQMGLAGRAKMEREYDRSLVIRAYLEEINSMERKQG